MATSRTPFLDLSNHYYFWITEHFCHGLLKSRSEKVHLDKVHSSVTSNPSPIDPRIVTRLAALRGRAQRLAVIHGLGTWIAATTLLLIASFYLDRFLAPPYAMQLAIAPVVWVAIGFGFYYWVFRRTRVRLSNVDAALLVERAYPKLEERLISAVQLSKDSGGASPLLVDRAIREGEDAARNLDFGKALRPKSARLWGSCGFFSLLIAATIFSIQPEDASVFFQRLIGIPAEFPQRTYLEVEIPARSTNVRVAREGDVIKVRIARGSDLAVRVTARGSAPDIVEMHTSEGQIVPLSRMPPNEYFGRFHGVKTPFSFYVMGGDDRDKRPLVTVETVTPPSLAKIQVSVNPPPYSAQVPFTREGGSFEALAGSRAMIRIETATPVERALLRFRGTDEEIAFQSSETSGDATATPSSRFYTELIVEKNARYSIELEDREGLRNPDPGSYSIIALADRAPEAKLQAPARTEVDVSVNGLFFIQARSSDDFGVTRVRLRVKFNNSGDFSEIDLPRIPIAHTPGIVKPESGLEPLKALAETETARTVVSQTRLDFSKLRTKPTKDEKTEAAPPTEDRPIQERDFVEFYVEALDGKAPKPGTGETYHVRAVVLSHADILKRITERFSRAKENVQTLLDIQNDRRRRVADLILAFDRPAVSSVLVGQNRISIDTKTLTREFFEGLESAAGNRLDRIGEAVFLSLERFRSEMAAGHDDPFAPEIAKAIISAIRSGSLGSPELLGELSEMLSEAVAVASDSSPNAAKALDAALLSTDVATSLAALEKARGYQDATIQSLERLLGMLSKWANFQDVITLTKEIVEQQKGLRARTKDTAQPTAPVK
ncbi:MAG: hypothetical protein ACKVS6_07225 [Planctomycetota bacterium]